MLREGLAPQTCPPESPSPCPRPGGKRPHGALQLLRRRRARSGSDVPASSWHPVLQSLIYQPPCHPANLSPLGSWGSLGGTVRRSCRPQLSWLRPVMTLHLALTGAGLFSRTFCTFCVSPSCLKRRGPEQSAGFSLFPKPRTHFLKSPFGHDFSPRPRGPPDRCDSPIWAPPALELWGALPPASGRSVGDLPLHSPWGPAPPSGPGDPRGKIPSI